ncbi:hypothetical protein B0A55_06223 [Friedmanniomyces simplex]|uniref:Uncharacterized protein n=1 Tax=Friedmanniomyces simplex TaxID=329884 RepID=A0A4U0X4F9_9PEZI|nr:hypothetical protein B0A55_06223 [Friedmanniomyces simplex]
MAHLGALTRGGLLYQGNYEGWKVRMDGMLEVHGLTLNPAAAGGYTLLRRVRRMITDQIGPELYDRLSFTDTWRPVAMLRVLATLARPFQFNDLPSELRSRIYGRHFGHWVCHVHPPVPAAGSKTSTPHKVPRFPALLLVSRSVCEEALPLLYRSTEFRLHWEGPHLVGLANKHDPELVSAIRTWARVSVVQNVKHLRRLSVRYDHSANQEEYTVTLDSSKGLQARYSRLLSLTREVAWASHIAGMEENRQALGLQGEVLVLVFTTKWDL